MSGDGKKHLCPVHKKALIRKRVVYGMPEGPDSIPKSAILGGCVVDENRQYGYVCPVDSSVYFVDENGKLEPQYDD